MRHIQVKLVAFLDVLPDGPIELAHICIFGELSIKSVRAVRDSI